MHRCVQLTRIGIRLTKQQQKNNDDNNARITIPVKCVAFNDLSMKNRIKMAFNYKHIQSIYTHTLSIFNHINWVESQLQLPYKLICY